MHPVSLFLHLTGVVVWVGGMFFAWMCLRPVVAAQLEPAARLRLWAAVFARFFPWVWVAVLMILISGALPFMAIGMKHAPPHWHLMLLIGVIMSAVFFFVFSSPYRKLKAAIAQQDWPAGAVALGRIRQLIGINLFLGIATVAVASIGRLLG